MSQGGAFFPRLAARFPDPVRRDPDAVGLEPQRETEPTVIAVGSHQLSLEPQRRNSALTPIPPAPSRTAQLAAAGAVIARSPATRPIRNASRYSIVPPRLVGSYIRPVPATFAKTIVFSERGEAHGTLPSHRHC